MPDKLQEAKPCDVAYAGQTRTTDLPGAEIVGDNPPDSR